MARAKKPVTVDTWYTVDSEQVTYSDQAPADIAGTVGTVWRVSMTKAHPHAHGPARQVASMGDEDQARAYAVERFAADQLVPVALAGGGTVEVKAAHLAGVRGLDAYGNVVVESDGIVAALTRCCQASGKGSIDSLSGVVCRCCYADVDDYFGGSARVSIPVAG